MSKQYSNLLRETIAVLKEHGRIPSDVYWIGTKDGKFHMSWHRFEQEADQLYNQGSGLLKSAGHTEVRKDLVAVGLDFWLERRSSEYGDERWEFLEPPILKYETQKLDTLFDQREPITGLGLDTVNLLKQQFSSPEF